MPTMRFRFPCGRYHATLWGHHVNEGLIEWPPSPWRMLRALIACGFATQKWDEVPAIARHVIDKLAAVQPLYRLPPASVGHSRHFMPIGALAKGREQTTLVFDAWANVGGGELHVHWPCELSKDESVLLARLAGSLGYLGRSESLVDAQLVEQICHDWNAVPCEVGEHRGREWEQVSVMVPIAPVEYAAWRSKQVDELLKPFEGKKQTAALKKQQAKALEPYPVDLVSCLTKDTAWWKGHGWSQPPGGCRVVYWRRVDALEVGVPMAPRAVSTRPVTTMLLALSTASGNRSALPPVTRTLPQAELLHRAIVGRLANGQRVHCPELTGKDELDRPLRSDHDHAHTIPVDLDGDERLDHVIIFARMGLRDAAQRAIRSLRKTWTKGGAGDIQVSVVGSGDLPMLRRLPPPVDQRIEAILGPGGGARVWESVTPYVLPKTLDRRAKRKLPAQVNDELVSRGFPVAAQITIDQELTRGLRQHIRRRSRGRAAPRIDAGYGLRLSFTEPVSGPVLLGYGSHYGLGLFRAVDA